MKKLLALILGLLCLTGCAKTYDGATEEVPMLTEYSVTHYYGYFDWEEEQEVNRTLFAYDIYGNRVRSMSYRNGELDSISNLRYDDRGNCIRETTWDHSGWFPRFDGRTEKTFDGQDRPLSTVTRGFWGQQLGASWYTYDDEAGTRTWENDSGSSQTAWLDEAGRELRTVSDIYETVYEYDQRGNMTGWVSYENGQPFDRYEVRYDDQNRQIWGGYYDASGALKNQTTFVYDDAGHTKTYEKNSGGKRVEYYHPDGRLHMIEDYNSDGTLSMLQQYTYRNLRVPSEGGTKP